MSHGQKAKTAETRGESEIVTALLAWYRANARKLPWRKTTDPYAIWISEIMLQQTQVKTVMPYWERWMRDLPTLEAFAAARTSRVLKLWEGLGYYSRARNAHLAAKFILKNHAGFFPTTREGLLALPGIGRYTAGAICSIAFDQPAPVLDGNVIRVLTRLYAIHSDPRNRPTNERLWHLAETLVETANATRVNGERPCAELNQALMELGAVICTTVAPQCDRCPVQNRCIAFRKRCVERLPFRSKKSPATARHFVGVVLEHRGCYLVRKRPADVVNANLWEFPNMEAGLNRSSRSSRGNEAHLSKLLQSLTTEVSGETNRKLPSAGIYGKAPAPFCTIKHTITRYRITLNVFRANVDIAPDPTTVPLNQLSKPYAAINSTMAKAASLSPRERAGVRGNATSNLQPASSRPRQIIAGSAKEGKWCTLTQLQKLPFSSAHKQILQKLVEARRNRGNDILTNRI